MKLFQYKTLFLLVTTMLPLSAKAGVVGSFGVNTTSFSFQPKDKEPTPNYYGHGAKISGGFSILSSTEFSLWGSYTPGLLKKPILLKEKASLIGVGVNLSVRLNNAICLEGRFGHYKYNLISKSNENELDGHWQGLGGGASIGALLVAKRFYFWHLSLDWDQAFLRKSSSSLDTNNGRRVLDSFSVSLNYTFRGNDKLVPTEQFFNYVIKSFSF